MVQSFAQWNHSSKSNPFEYRALYTNISLKSNFSTLFYNVCLTWPCKQLWRWKANERKRLTYTSLEFYAQELTSALWNQSLHIKLSPSCFIPSYVSWGVHDIWQTLEGSHLREILQIYSFDLRQMCCKSNWGILLWGTACVTCVLLCSKTEVSEQERYLQTLHEDFQFSLTWVCTLCLIDHICRFRYLRYLSWEEF